MRRCETWALGGKLSDRPVRIRTLLNLMYSVRYLTLKSFHCTIISMCSLTDYFIIVFWKVADVFIMYSGYLLIYDTGTKFDDDNFLIWL